MSAPILTNNETSYYVLAVLSWTDVGFIYTYRYSCGGRSLHVGSGSFIGTYTGGVLGWPVYTEERGNGLLPSFVWPSVSISITRNHDSRDEVDALVSRLNTACSGGYKPTLTLYFTSGATVASTDVIFTGTIDNGGVVISSDSITLKSDHWLKKYDVDLPKSRNWTSKKTGDPGAYGELMPVIYGDWNRKNDAYLIPCVIVDRRTEIVDGSNNVKVEICDTTSSGIHALGGRLKWTRSDGTAHGFEIWGSTYPRESDDLAEATVELGESQAVDAGSQKNVWQKSDTVHIQYLRGNDNSSAVTITEPVDAIYDLLAEYAGVPTVNIGDSITPGSGSQLNTGLKCRAFLKKQKKIITGHVTDICQSFGLLLLVVNNCLEIAIDPLFDWEYGSEGDDIDVQPYQALDSQVHTLWPESLTKQRIVIEYDKTPDGDYRGRAAHYEPGDSGEPIFRLKSDWIYRRKDASSMVGNIEKVATNTMRALELSVPIAGLQLGIAEKPTGATGATKIPRICWTGDGLTAKFFYPYKVEIDYGTGLGHAWMFQQAFRFYRAYVAANGSPNYDASSYAQKIAHGFYTDNDGTLDSDTIQYSNTVD